MSNFLIEKLHNEAPTLINGVILSNPGSLRRKHSKVGEDVPAKPGGLLSKESISRAAANLFMGSVASLNIDAIPQFHRRTQSDER